MMLLKLLQMHARQNFNRSYIGKTWKKKKKNQNEIVINKIIAVGSSDAG